jgi:hypothetical protein
LIQFKQNETKQNETKQNEVKAKQRKSKLIRGALGSLVRLGQKVHDGVATVLQQGYKILAKNKDKKKIKYS